MSNVFELMEMISDYGSVMFEFGKCFDRCSDSSADSFRFDRDARYDEILDFIKENFYEK